MAPTESQSSPAPLSCLEKPLPLDGFQGTPDEIEQQWYDRVYLGSGDRMKQLTWRAVIVGMLLGSILSLTNLYANLKMGWSFGVALTAGIISFALWNAFVRLGISKSPMTILENTCMQSAASSAGYSTGGTLTSAVAALLLLTGQHMPLGVTFAWIFFIAVLGVTMAIPMKRQMINIEQIRFPDSIATAETLKVLYSEGKKAAGQAKALLYSALFASANAIAMAAGGEQWLGTAQQQILGNWYQRTIFFKWDLMFVGAGALVGMKTSLSLFIGGTVCWALYVPWLESQGLLPAGAGYRDSVGWTLWGGTACMVVASIVAFLFQWKSIVRSFSSLGAMFSLTKRRELTDVEKIETPMSWFLAGQLVSLAALGYLAHVTFDVPYWMSCIAVIISFFLALVVCRITGEANITPTGAMGKVTQLIFGGIAPGHVTANLMAANITSGASSSSADLLVDLKVGYLLGAIHRPVFRNLPGNPRLRAGLPLHGPRRGRASGLQCSWSQNMGGHGGSAGHGLQPPAQHQGSLHHRGRHPRPHSGACPPLPSRRGKMAPHPHRLRAGLGHPVERLLPLLGRGRARLGRGPLFQGQIQGI